MGWMILREENIKQAVEIAFANETNVADLNGSIMSPWARFPEGVAISRIFGRKLFTENIVVHRTGQ